MPPARLWVRVTVVPLEVRTGEWCDRCLLPSVITVLYLMELDGRPCWAVQRYDECEECGPCLSR